MLHIYFFCLTKNIFYNIITLYFEYFDCTFYIYFFNAIKTKPNQNISGTNSEILSSSNGFLTCVKNFFGCNNGKIIISVATGLGIGFTFGWIFSPISIGVLIILAVVDSQFTLPKTIQVFNFFTSCLSCKQSSAGTNSQPNLEKQNEQIE